MGSWALARGRRAASWSPASLPDPQALSGHPLPEAKLPPGQATLSPGSKRLRAEPTDPPPPFLPRLLSQTVGLHEDPEAL